MDLHAMVEVQIQRVEFRRAQKIDREARLKLRDAGQENDVRILAELECSKAPDQRNHIRNLSAMVVDLVKKSLGCASPGKSPHLRCEASPCQESQVSSYGSPAETFRHWHSSPVLHEESVWVGKSGPDIHGLPDETLLAIDTEEAAYHLVRRC